MRGALDAAGVELDDGLPAGKLVALPGMADYLKHYGNDVRVASMALARTLKQVRVPKVEGIYHMGDVMDATTDSGL